MFGWTNEFGLTLPPRTPLHLQLPTDVPWHDLAVQAAIAYVLDKVLHDNPIPLVDGAT